MYIKRWHQQGKKASHKVKENVFTFYMWQVISKLYRENPKTQEQQNNKQLDLKVDKEPK